MKKEYKHNLLYIMAIAIGLALTPAAIKAAYIYRGCFAVGGELLLVPMLVMLVYLVDDVRKTFWGGEALGEGVEEEWH